MLDLNDLNGLVEKQVDFVFQDLDIKMQGEIARQKKNILIDFLPHRKI
jgi:hypothetical protein